MPFDLEHWRNPRRAIATRYQNDDVSYITHGALLAMECVCRFEIPPTQARDMTVLDYGCGTGRVARVLAGYFGSVVGYDPVKECIDKAVVESKVPQSNVQYCNDISTLGKGRFDAAVSCNVIEHLSEQDQRIMLQQLQSACKPQAMIVLWYSMKGNRDAIREYFGDSWVKDDDELIEKFPESGINVRIFRT